MAGKSILVYRLSLIRSFPHSLYWLSLAHIGNTLIDHGPNIANDEQIMVKVDDYCIRALDGQWWAMNDDNVGGIQN